MYAYTACTCVYMCPFQEDSDFSDSVDDKHTSLREKFRQFQEILVLVQVYLGIVADIEEGVKKWVCTIPLSILSIAYHFIVF